MMQLNFEQIRSVTLGADRFEQSDEGIRFYRFTPEQHQLYSEKTVGLFEKSQATAGVKLCFRTDSTKLFFKALFQNAYCRSYFSVDVFANDKPVGYLDNFSGQELPQDYSNISFPVGVFTKEFDLGEGVKTVTVHLPWNKKVALQALSLDDGAFIEPVKPEKKLLAFGDSITQGFDSLRPSRRYISRLAAALDAQEFNKAVGGECYEPNLPAMKENFIPDYIVAAYGTNDWRSTDPVSFTARCNAFYKNLQRNYPAVKAFVITPIWRSNLDIETKFESFADIEKTIRQICGGMENVTLISGMDLVPHDVRYFGDYGLHPNAEGFDHYFTNLWTQINK